MAAKVKTENEVLESALNPNPKELDKGLEAKKPKVEVSTHRCDPLCQLTHMWNGHPGSAVAPTKKAAAKTNTAGNSLTEATETVSIPKATLKAACAAMDELREASAVKS